MIGSTLGTSHCAGMIRSVKHDCAGLRGGTIASCDQRMSLPSSIQTAIVKSLICLNSLKRNIVMIL